MSKQKIITKSWTIWSALLTLAIALSPILEQGVETEFEDFDWLGAVSILLTTSSTIFGRYRAKEQIYTPHGLPGRDYVSETHQVFESPDSGVDADRL